MPDDVDFQSATLATPPAATKVATDQVGTKHYQKFKLADGTADSETMAKVTSEGSLQAITPTVTVGPSTLNAMDEAIELETNGLNIYWRVAAGGDLLGTLTFEAFDGVTWNTHSVYDYNNATPVNSVTDPDVFNDSLYYANGSVYYAWRMRISAYTSGGVSIVAAAGQGDHFQVPGVTYVADFLTGNPVSVQSPPISGASGALAVGIVDSSGNQITSFGGSTQYTEGDTDASITGTAMLWEDSADTLRAVSAAKPLPVGDAGGSITVDGTVGVTGVSTLTEQQTQTTALQLIDDTVYTDDTSTHATGTSKGNLIMAAATPTDASVNANDIGAVAMTTDRKLHVSVQDALPAGTANIGDVDVLTVPSPLSTAGNGTAATAHRVTIASDSTGQVAVASIAAGTNYVGKVRLTDGTLDSSLVDETGTNAVDAVAVGGGTPHDSVDSGNPLKVGVKAANAFPTAVANLDRANAIGDLFGRQMVTHIDPAQQVFKSYNDTASRSAGSAQVVWDPTSGKKIAVTSYVVSAYGTTAGRIFLFFADDADLTYTAGTDQALLVASYAPSSSSKPGTVWCGAVPIFCTTADRRLHYQNDAAISVDITIYGYEW